MATSKTKTHSVDDALEVIMGNIFGDGYISPNSGAVYHAATKLLALIRPEDYPAAAQEISVIGVAVKEDCEA